MDADSLIVRFAGAKFAVLVENVTDFDLGARLADRFDEAARIPVDVDGEHVYVGVSIGITTSERNYRNVDDVVSDVSTAATRAKQLARGTKKRRFSTNMRMEALTKMRLEMALREAVEREEFELYFQPIVSLRSGRLIAFESLIRWESPERGRISPAEFIPIAEQTGLILPIGRWALREAARKLRMFVDEVPGARDLGVSVNLSARQVSDADLLHCVARALNETQVDPANFKIELTESVLMDNMDEVAALLTNLRELGVQIWVDDFGTGYSSLSYLHRFPVDGLKVDKTFVDGLGPDPTDSSAAMVRTMVSLSEQLAVDLVAEGIETQGQADFLRDVGCMAGQGYFFGRPAPADEALALLKGG
ncbi:MAG: GGDEF domain-containing protein [Deltaproteobacteria bacterium]|nr:MAG: GGDEF domain-containing protein [Deltaproteobacteria bacterium]